MLIYSDWCSRFSVSADLQIV